MPFLSLLDDRARPKGSRDPLGFELVWTYFGRKVVGNLTTITSSLENFAVALLGFHWANELCININKDDKQKAVRETFLRYEQIAAYMRYYGKSDSVMGITRVTKRVRPENDSKTLNIGTGAEEQILSDQASYGLWGLYSAAMRDTGLVKGSERVVTEKGLNIANIIEKKLDKLTFFRLLESGSVKKEEIEKLSASFMKAISSSEMCKILVDSLMVGSEKKHLQRELWIQTNKLFNEKKLPKTQTDILNAYVAALMSAELSVELNQHLQDICDVERVLVSLNNIFHYCRYKDAAEFEKVIQSLLDQGYSYDHLPDTLPDTSFPRRNYIQSALIALKASDYSETINQLFMLNADVMKQRNGAPWVELEGDGKIRVRVKNETAKLATLERLKRHWDYDYFLGSYLSMARAYLEGPHG